MTLLRPDLALIAEHVASGSRVLDVGCGDGALMAALRDQCGADARGLELDPENVAAAMARGLSVVQGDADTDLGYYQDDSFDYAILSQTLQTTKRPDLVIDRQSVVLGKACVSTCRSRWSPYHSKKKENKVHTMTHRKLTTRKQ